ncbi:MAG: hypothetical protein PHZ23_14850, partial [Acidiphilium sp.]|nr:hypothetical protein [Acidiphilium sp.]
MPILNGSGYGGPWGLFTITVPPVTDGTFAVFALGHTTTTTNIYTYSSNAVATGTVLTGNLANSGAAAGNSTLGVFALGGNTTTTNIYTYSSNAVATGTALTTGLGDGAAAGNSTLGVFALGDNATTNIYTYSSNAVATGT